MNGLNLLVQLSGLFGMTMGVIAFQCNQHKKLLFFRTMNDLFFAIQYFLLGAYAGAITNLLVCLRNSMLSRSVAHQKDTKLLVLGFSVLFVLVGVLSWQGSTSVLIILVKLLSTLAYASKSPRTIRLVSLITSSGWSFFNYSIGSYAGMVAELLTLTFILIGILKFDLLPYFRSRQDFFYTPMKYIRRNKG